MICIKNIIGSKHTYFKIQNQITFFQGTRMDGVVTEQRCEQVLEDQQFSGKHQPSTSIIDETSAFRAQTIRKVGRPRLLKNCNKERNDNTNMPKRLKTEKKMLIPDNVLENKTTEVGRFWAVETPLKTESIKLLRDLISFYTTENLERLIVPRTIKSLGIQKNYELSEVIKSEIDGISLRAIEWLVTNYSKGIKIVLFNEKTKKYIDIHNDYEIQSNYYKRNLFDPFCRRERVFFFWKLKSLKNSEIEDVVMMTTVGQMCFMKWAFENGVLKYAHENQDEIQKTMESVLSRVHQEKKQCKKEGKVRKRKELTKEPDIYCTVYNLETSLHFDHLDCDFASPPSSPHPISSRPISPHPAKCQKIE